MLRHTEQRRVKAKMPQKIKPNPRWVAECVTGFQKMLDRLSGCCPGRTVGTSKVPWGRVG